MTDPVDTLKQFVKEAHAENAELQREIRLLKERHNEELTQRDIRARYREQHLGSRLREAATTELLLTTTLREIQVSCMGGCIGLHGGDLQLMWVPPLPPLTARPWRLVPRQSGLGGSNDEGFHQGPIGMGGVPNPP